MRRPASLRVLLGIENRKVFTDDFSLFVLFDVTRASIPGGDYPGSIQQENGVILHAVGHQLEKSGIGRFACY
jgi:hypothetical protein